MFEDFLKNLLKKIKLSESTISTVLGGLVIIVVGVLIFNYFKAGKKPQQALETPKEKLTEEAASKEEEKSSSELPEIHKVAANESLWKISEKYYHNGYNWPEIAKENNLSNPDLLVEGQELKLPKIAAKKSEQKLSEEKTKPEQAIKGNTYKVQKGDYLWKIAVRAYGDGFKWPEIAKENNLSNPDLLVEGQELKLPK